MAQRVLAIDDSPLAHRLLAARLKPEGLELHHALDAAHGLAEAQAIHPDLILLDIDLGPVSGFTVCEQLKADPSTAPIPIIFLSGDAEVDDKLRGFELGAVDYITKPFNADELCARVRTQLRIKSYQDRLATMSSVDALTGLRNRGHFDQCLATEVAASVRYGRKLCLLMFDLDHFKRLNDTHGHPFGDRVLKTVGEVLVSSVRATDTACRYGGEEFAIVLPETSEPQGLVVAERIRARLAAAAFIHDGEAVRVTASMGLGASDNVAGTLTPEAIIKLADDGLYLAKRSGRDCICRAS